MSKWVTLKDSIMQAPEILGEAQRFRGLLSDFGFLPHERYLLEITREVVMMRKKVWERYRTPPDWWHIAKDLDTRMENFLHKSSREWVVSAWLFLLGGAPSPPGELSVHSGLPDGKWLQQNQEFDLHRGQVKSLTIFEDSVWVGCKNGVIQCWNGQGVVEQFVHPDHLSVVKVMPDLQKGTLFASFSSEMGGEVWQIKPRPARLWVCKGGKITTTALSPGANFLFVGTANEVKIIGLKAEVSAWSVLPNTHGPVWDAVFLSACALVWSMGDYLHRYDLENNLYERLGRVQGVRKLALSKERFLAVSQGKSINIWDMGTNSFRYLGQHEDVIECLSFVPDNLVVSAGDRGGMIRFWDIKRRTELVERSIALSLSAVVSLVIWGDWLIAASAEGKIFVRKIRDMG